MGFSIFRTLSLVLRTWPFIALRIAVYAAIAVGFVVMGGAGAGTGWAAGVLFGAGVGGAFWGGVAGLALAVMFLRLLRAWLLYMVKAAHIAILVEGLTGLGVPGGIAQISHGQAVVRARFLEANLLFAVDLLIKGVLRAISRVLLSLSTVLPIPGLRALAKAVQAVLSVAIGLMDEVVLAHSIRTASTNPYESAQEALVLYAQNGRTILKSAIFIVIAKWVLGLAIFALLVGPAIGLGLMMSEMATGAGIILAVIAAIALNSAIIEPFAICALMQVYFGVIEGQTPRADWRNRLSEVSGQFREITEKAVEFGRGMTPPPPAESPRSTVGGDR